MIKVHEPFLSDQIFGEVRNRYGIEHCLCPGRRLYRVEKKHGNNPLLIHTAPLTLCLLSTAKTRTS